MLKKALWYTTIYTTIRLSASAGPVCSMLQYTTTDIAATSRQYGYQPGLSVVYYSILQTGTRAGDSE